MHNLNKNCSQILSCKLGKTVDQLTKSKSTSNLKYILDKKTSLNYACVIPYQEANI